MNAGRKHSPNGPAMRTPARSAAAAAAWVASWRDCSASSVMPCASALPEQADRRASRIRASDSASLRPETDQATSGSAPRASRSEARCNTERNAGGAVGAVAAAAAETVIPADRQTASTSRVEAVAIGSPGRRGGRTSRRCRCTAPARCRARTGPVPSRRANASSSAAAAPGGITAPPGRRCGPTTPSRGRSGPPRSPAATRQRRR